jgi:STE24 endopeptidase
MNWIFGVVVAVVLVRLGVQLWLERLNRQSIARQRAEVPAGLSGVVSEQEHQRSADYALEHNRLSTAEMIYAVALKLMILGSGVLAIIYNSTILRFGSDNFWALALMMSVVSILLSIMHWPFDWRATFGIEAKYGFNRTTPALWLSDTLKEIGLGLLLTVPLTAVVLWMASGGILNWWLWAFIVMVVYEVILTFIYPNYIEPLFNKFEPLPDGPLRDRLHALARRAGVPVGKILVMDASKRSAHANAYFAGFGSSRRIVLYDTLISQLSHEEIEAVLAHEIGHMRHQHILRQMYVGSAWQLVGLCIVAQLILWPDFYAAFGLSREGGVAGAFFILSFISGAFGFWLNPMMSHWSRQHEYQADATAAELVGSGSALISGLKKMTKESLSSIEDHPLSHRFYSSHPTLAERERALEAWAKARPAKA